MTRFEAFNRLLFLHINADGHTPPWLIDGAVGIAEGLIYLMPVLLLYLWFWGIHPHRRLAIKACIVTLTALAINQAIAVFWTHPRPFMIGLGHTWISHVPDSSFPSDHMTVFAAVAVTLLFGGAWRLGALAALTGLVVAWARIFLGLHFPFDMVGAVLVSVSAYGFIRLWWCKISSPFISSAEKLYRALFAPFIARGWVQP